MSLTDVPAVEVEVVASGQRQHHDEASNVYQVRNIN